MSSNTLNDGRLDDGGFSEILARAGVQNVAWSLITGRCGSTYLASLTRAARFGSGSEPLNDLTKTSAEKELPSYLEKTIRNSAINGRWYFQINWPRFEKLESLLPVFEQEPSLVLRRNIFAQALSYWNAQKTGLWHEHSERTFLRQAKTPDLDPAGWVRKISTYEVAIKERFPNARTFYYEDIVASPTEMLHEFVRYHGAEIDPKNINWATTKEKATTRKIEREGYASQYAKLTAEFGPDVVSRRLERCTPVF